MDSSPHLRWRWYRSAAGNAPVKDFLDVMSDVDHAAVVAGMNEVRREGPPVARRLTGDLWEVRAVGIKAHYRLIFSQEGRRALPAPAVFGKDTAPTPAPRPTR